ncbi:hypothetical protein Ccrd_010440, partial [Cynara cardunculus var. scolymus]
MGKKKALGTKMKSAINARIFTSITSSFFYFTITRDLIP